MITYALEYQNIIQYRKKRSDTVVKNTFYGKNHKMAIDNLLLLCYNKQKADI